MKGAKGLIRVGDVVSNSLVEGNQVVVVTSAPAGLPEEIVTTAEAARNGKGLAVGRFIRRLRARLRNYAKKAITRENLRSSVVWETSQFCDKLESLLYSVYHTGELTMRTRDRLMTLAERISASLVSGRLETLGIATAPLTAHDAGIATDSAFGHARPITGITEVNVRRNLLPLLERGVTPVIAGNAAADEHGDPTTLGVGGSDYSASLIGAAIPVDEIWIWARVDGIMTADPKIVRTSRTIPVLSYDEAAELAFSGVKVLHPGTIEPAIDKDIPVIVRNVLDPTSPGTRILREPKRYEGIVRSVSLIKGVAMVAVEGASMIGTPGTAARVFGAMGRNGINVLMISQSSSETNISFIVQRSDLSKALAALNAEFRDELIRRFFVRDDVCVVAVIGVGMRGTPGIASRVFTAVANKGINVLMAAQGSSELNISFVVNEVDGEGAVRAIHRKFELDKQGDEAR